MRYNKNNNKKISVTRQTRKNHIKQELSLYKRFVYKTVTVLQPLLLPHQIIVITKLL